MSLDAMKQALEALEELADEVFSPYDNKLGDAILALRAAIEQANEFNPDWDALAVMVDEQQRMAKRIEELEAQQNGHADFDMNNIYIFSALEQAKRNTTESIAALRAAIEQAQEPVALETVYDTIIQWDEGGGKRSRRELARRIVALYTAPRQWQGLTEAEKVNVAIDCGCADVAWMDFADAIEAKLKEKNT